MTDIHEVLSAEHLEMTDILSRIGLTENAGAADRAALLEMLRGILDRHTAFEETVFYPAAREATDMEDIVATEMDDHMAARRKLADIDELDPGTNAWRSAVIDLAAILADHAEAEENILFPRSREALTAHQKSAMAADYKKQIKK